MDYRRLASEILIAIIVASLLLWSVVSMAWLTLACGSYEWLCWVPAVATNGVAGISTWVSLTERLDRSTRHYAVIVAITGIAMDVIATSGQHYLALEHPGVDPRNYHPNPMWGWVVGGLPSLMAGLLGHVIFRIYAQNRREKEAELLAAARAAEQQRIDRELAIEREREDARIAVKRETEARIAEANAQQAADEREAAQKNAVAKQAEADILKAQAQADRRTAREQRASQSAVSTAVSNGQPDVSGLVDPAQRVAADLRKRGQKLDRDSLQEGIRREVGSCSTARAAVLLKMLKSGQISPAPDRPPLRAVVR